MDAMNTDETFDIHRAVQPGPMAEVYAAVAGLPGHERAIVLDAWTACASSTSEPLRRARRLSEKADAAAQYGMAGRADAYRRLATLAVGGAR